MHKTCLKSSYTLTNDIETLYIMSHLANTRSMIPARACISSYS